MKRSTGFTDKNGHEIHEGDSGVYYEGAKPGVVTWEPYIGDPKIIGWMVRWNNVDLCDASGVVIPNWCGGQCPLDPKKFAVLKRDL